MDLIDIFQKIAVSTGLPPLVVEAGFLLLITALLLSFILIVLVIFRIKKEIIKFNAVAGYLSRMITRGAAEIKISRGYYDFKEEEWRDGFTTTNDVIGINEETVNADHKRADTNYIILDMLLEGDSHDEIIKKVNVTRAFISKIELWAKREGFL